MKKITLAITGASGAQYGFRLLQVLLDQGCEVHLLISAAARQVCALEMSIDLPNEDKAMLDYVAKKFNVIPLAYISIARSNGRRRLPRARMRLRRWLSV